MSIAQSQPPLVSYLYLSQLPALPHSNHISPTVHLFILPSGLPFFSTSSCRYQSVHRLYIALSRPEARLELCAKLEYCLARHKEESNKPCFDLSNCEKHLLSVSEYLTHTELKRDCLEKRFLCVLPCE